MCRGATLLLWGLALAGPEVQAAPPEAGPAVSVVTSVDRTRVRVGDAIAWNVTVTYDSTLALAGRVPEDALEGFEVRSRRSESRTEGTRRVAVEEYVLTSYALGEHSIGGRALVVESPGGRTDTVWTAAVPVEVVSVLPDSAQNILDIRGPAEIPNPATSWWVAGLAAGGAAALLLGGLWLRRRRVRRAAIVAPPPRPAHEVAYEALEELRRQDLPGTGQMKAYYVALSETVRRYLGARFHVPALDRTTGELMHLLKEVEEARPAAPDVRDILDLSDGAKFARQVGTLEEAGRAMERSFEVVDRTKSTEAAIPEAKGA